MRGQKEFRSDTIYLSASQLETYLSCPQKWVFQYVEKLPRPENESAKLGTEVHAILETFGKTGSIDFSCVHHTDQARYAKAAEIAARATHLVPRDPDAIQEREFELEIGEVDGKRVVIWGYQDVYEPQSPKRRLPVVTDYKTTGNLAYAKTPEDLRQDLQATIYAREATQAAPGVVLRWVYMSTKSQDVLETKVEYTQNEVSERYESIREFALALAAAKNFEKITFLPTNPAVKNLDSCSAYGGCPYQGRCLITARERLTKKPGGKVTMENRTEDLRARLLAKYNKGESTLNPPEVAKVADPLLAIAPKEDEPDADTVEVATSPTEPAEPAKRKPGRPRKDAVPPPQGEVKMAQLELPLRSLPTSEVQSYAKAIVSEFASKRELALYIDCQPSNSERFTDLSILFDETNKRFTEDFGFSHWTLAEYGKGKGAWIETFQKVFATEAPPEAFISTGWEETPMVLPFLRAHYGSQGHIVQPVSR